MLALSSVGIPFRPINPKSVDALQDFAVKSGFIINFDPAWRTIMTMRVICAWLLMCAICFGQTYQVYTPDPAWMNVLHLPMDADISVKTKGRKYQGYIQHADDNYLVIMSSEKSMFGPGRRWIPRKLAKDQILEVRLNRRMLSGLAGGAVGVGAGAAVGLIVDSRYKNGDMYGLVAFVLGLVGGLIGAAVSHTHPFIKGKTIYLKAVDKN
jgi:hypothetical protein